MPAQAATSSVKGLRFFPASSKEAASASEQSVDAEPGMGWLLGPASFGTATAAAPADESQASTSASGGDADEAVQPWISTRNSSTVLHLLQQRGYRLYKYLQLRDQCLQSGVQAGPKPSYFNL